MGGIQLLRNEDNNKIKLCREHSRYIHFVCEEKLNNIIWLSMVRYGYPHQNLQQQLWSEIESLCPTNNEPWMIIGDLDILSSSIKNRCSLSNSSRFIRFISDFINRNGLIDLGYQGHSYGIIRQKVEQLCSKGQTELLANQTWVNLYKDVTVEHLVIIDSDHAPIVLLTDPKKKYKKRNSRLDQRPVVLTRQLLQLN